MKRLQIISVLLVGLGIFSHAVYADSCAPGQVCFTITGMDNVSLAANGDIQSVGGGTNATVSPASGDTYNLNFSVTNSGSAEQGAEYQTGQAYIYNEGYTVCGLTWRHDFYTDGGKHDRFQVQIDSGQCTVIGTNPAHHSGDKLTIKYSGSS